MGFLKLFFNAYQGYSKYKKEDDSRKLDLVFYSETKNDLKFFGRIFEILDAEYQKHVHYLTSDPNDPYLGACPKNVSSYFIGDGVFRTMLFKTINAKVFVMTLPDLETFHLKRSLNNVHYIYLFHNMLSSHMVFRKGAFDSYDTIFTVGPHHEKEIRKTESLYRLKEKRLLRHGYPLLDKIITESKEKGITPGERLTILIGCSWGKDSISNLCIEEVIDSLISLDAEIIYRPHPMTGKQNPEILENVNKKFGDKQNFTLEVDISGNDSLYRSHVLISDWSGVAYEYAFGLEKPVVFIDTPRKINNSEYDKIGIPSFEESIRPEVGEVVSLQNIAELPDKVSKLHSEGANFRDRIVKIRENNIYNIGKSDEIGAKHIVSILEEVSESETN